MITAADGYQVWSDRYDRMLDDIFAIQDEISQAIVERLKVRLVGEERKPLVTRYTDNIEAYNLYLKGRFYWNKREPEAFEKAIECFEQALAADADYALAYVGLADCYFGLGLYEVHPPRQIMPKAKAAARMALEMDDTLAEAHTSLGTLAGVYDYDWSKAETVFQRAMELNPDHAATRYWYAYFFLVPTGRLDHAAEQARRALELDPVTPVVSTGPAHVSVCRRHYETAIEQMQKALELDANCQNGNLILGLAHLYSGSYNDAIQAFEKVNVLSWRLGGLGQTYAAMGRRSEARKLLEVLRETRKKRGCGACGMSMIHVGLGENEHALECLEKAYEERDPLLVLFRGYPVFDPLRSDPRFQDLLKRIGLRD